MNEEMISRRFWFEHESGRRLFPLRQKNQKTGKALFRVGKGAGANQVRNQRELDDIEDVYRHVFHKGWLVRMRAADGWGGMYGKDGPSIVLTSEGAAHGPVIADYRAAFESMDISAKARVFLVAHYYAPDHQASMESLAESAGYDSYAPVNLHYGAFAHKVADVLPTSPSDVPDARYANWMQALAHSHGERDDKGHFLWTLRPEVVEAMESMRWVTPDHDNNDSDAAGYDGSQDDTLASGSTMCQAVIEARRGQGPFRWRVRQYWGGRCAVTGCSLTSVLVASHIKPWADSTDVERVDGFNGVLLTPNLDKLFDAHLISFDKAGGLLVAPKLSGSDAMLLGLNSDMRLSSIHPRHLPYLTLHRKRCEGKAGSSLKAAADALRV